MARPLALRLLFALPLVAVAGAACGSTSGSDAVEAFPEAGADAPPDAPGNGSIVDASAPKTVDAGADAATGTVPVLFGTCPRFSACDGDPKGSWRLDAVCLTLAAFEPITTYCGNSIDDTTIGGTASGTLKVDATTVDSNVHIDFHAKAHIYGGCAAQGCATYASSLAKRLGSYITGATTCTANTAGECGRSRVCS